MCQSKSVKQIQVAPQAQESSSEDEYTFLVRKSEPNSKQPKAKLRILDTDIEMLVDTEDTVNIIDEKSLHNLKGHPNLEQTSTKV
jgi:CRISPR/Cas system-associated protein Cas5 (RAMP superfamily)